MLLNKLFVNTLVHLRPRRPDRSSFGAVQNLKLESGPVREFSHNSAQHINFTDDLTFCQAANCRITRHAGDAAQVHGNQGSFLTQTRRNGCRFHAGMSASDNKNIKLWLTPFHVELFPDTKGTENTIYNIVRCCFAQKLIQRLK